MKKFLAVIMAVMMMFGVFSAATMSASAETYTGNNENFTVPDGKVLVVLNFIDCSSKIAIEIFNMQTLANETTIVEGGYAYMLVNAGAQYLLPSVKAPEGYDFTSWYCYNDQQYYGSASQRSTTAEDSGKIVQYMVHTEPGEIEPDTMTTIKGILVKVFGIIVGLFLGDTAQGMELVSKLFDTVFA